ncbi:unnamed protein product [marine sediment metagenome]|uniref:Uncharacterized protein n=1 Tax=marine sediment metagenome TaxID=412755 RepID=X0XIU2_9ZZZZ
MTGDIDLEKLNISVPTKFVDGKPVSYNSKSIAKIIDGGDWFELVTLEQWITKQFLDHVEWDIRKEIDDSSVGRALLVFQILGIEPTECTYDM